MSRSAWCSCPPSSPLLARAEAGTLTVPLGGLATPASYRVPLELVIDGNTVNAPIWTVEHRVVAR